MVAAIKKIRFFYLVFLIIFSPGNVSAKVKFDDVSHLNETIVSEIRKPVNEAQIQQAIFDAVATKRKISIAGRRHSQGGHILYDNALVLDMMSYNKIIGLSADKKTLKVQSGATWEQIQDFLNPLGLAVAVEQSSNIFTVGGSLSVNAHGRDPRYGPIIGTVKSLRLVKADGEIITVSSKENSNLFSLVIGGYGLFGVITEVDLEVVPNSILQKTTEIMNCKDYPDFVIKEVIKDDKTELHYARPDIRKNSFMQKCSVTSYKRIAESGLSLQPLQQEKLIATSKWLMNLSRKSAWGKNVRWFVQDEFLDSAKDKQIISRNNAMRPPIKFLDYSSELDTDILQEYFLPIENATNFMDDLKEVSSRYDINLLSVTLRALKGNNSSFLSYAPKDTVAFVLYINIKKDDASQAKAKLWTRLLIDKAIKRNGTYYLAYANYATNEQIHQAYPKLKSFFEQKIFYDPSEIFMNKFYSQYGGFDGSPH